MRRSMVVGNWKMNCTVVESLQIVMGINAKIANGKQEGTGEIVVCPPFTSLADLGRFLSQTRIALGAQNMGYEKSGAFTGEISPLMLKDLGCRYVLVGHSERRTLMGENNDIIQKKVSLALEEGLHPILCVGESLEQREDNQTEQVVQAQLTSVLQGVTLREQQTLVVAYEPVWAIGTGRNATPDQAGQVCRFIRSQLTRLLGERQGQQIRILYGGSVKPDNASQLMEQQDIDGLLIGGASLDVKDFCSIIQGVN